MKNTNLINQRTIKAAQYIIENNSTIRKAAKNFNVSKSTIHRDIHKRLSKINNTLYNQVNEIFQKNFNEKHIRGGESTKKKYTK
jgi:putative DeoR family transcriptional regulator (stage III sporulation protein D)